MDESVVSVVTTHGEIFLSFLNLIKSFVENEIHENFTAKMRAIVDQV